MTETGLSKKGYSISKNDLSKKELSDLKKLMTLKPFVNDWVVVENEFDNL